MSSGKACPKVQGFLLKLTLIGLLGKDQAFPETLKAPHRRRGIKDGNYRGVLQTELFLPPPHLYVEALSATHVMGLGSGGYLEDD